MVYDTFTDELRAGYAARIHAREAWFLDHDVHQGVQNGGRLLGFWRIVLTKFPEIDYGNE